MTDRGPARAPLTVDADAFAAFYDRTCGPAFSLAFRITRDDQRAEEACEAAYAALVAAHPPAGAWVEADEADLLDRVRAEGLTLQRRTLVEATDGPPPTYTDAAALRGALAGLDPEIRRALELAYFGGQSVPAIAELLGRPAEGLRAAMREALLLLGRMTRGEETGGQ